MRLSALLVLSLGFILPFAQATPWGEDRHSPDEAECQDLFDSLFDSGEGGGIPDVPPDCVETRESTYGLDLCGCYILSESTMVCPAATTTTTAGMVCGLEANFVFTQEEGSFNASGGRVSVTGYGGSAEAAMAVAESLWLAGELAADAGRERVPIESALTGSVEADKTVGAGDAEVDAGDMELDSLVVDGLYVVLGDLDVTGDIEVNGLLIVQGDITGGALTVTGGSIPLWASSGGMVFAQGAVVDSVSATDAILYLRDLLTNEEGSLAVSGDTTATDTWIDAGEGLVAGGDVLLTNTVIASRETAGDAVSFSSVTLSRAESIRARTFLMDSSTVGAPARLDIAVSEGATFQASSVSGGGVELHAASVMVSADSTMESVAREDAALVLAIDPDESGATGLYLEQVWGASFGGYGGTESWLNANTFRPAASPSGDPRDPSGHGVDGWALSWATTTYGGGGGNDLVIVASGSATLDGLLTANGGPAPVGPLGGGGSGGSGGVVRIEAATLGGAARVTANGGNGSVQAEGNSIGLSGGGGSGGRIAVIADTFDGMVFEFEAVGGLGGVLNGVLDGSEEPAYWVDRRVHGGPGTTYVKEGATETLTIDGDGLDPAEWGCGGTGAECRGLGWLPTDLAGVDVVVRDATVALSGLDARSLTLEGAVLVPDDPRERLPWPFGDTLIDEGLSTSQMYWPIAVYEDELSERIAVTLTDSLEVDAGSTLRLGGYGGYSRGTAQADQDAGRLCWNGGSHGGAGGAGIPGPGLADTEPDAAFDDELQPTEVGRGGCGDFGWTGEEQAMCGVAGLGGAALHVAAGGAVTLDGTIEAEGWNGRNEDPELYCISNLGNAGGAGGAVWIQGATVSGAGTVVADGGDGARTLDGQACGGGGGGGRVSLQGDTRGWSGTLTAAGGAAGCDLSAPGGDGTVHLDTTDEPDPEDTSSDADSGADSPAPTTEGCAGCASGQGVPLGMLALTALAGLGARRRSRAG